MKSKSRTTSKKKISFSATQGTLADQKLSKLGYALTQGGEPTFVPIDPSLPEWNTTALGDEKLQKTLALATTLIPKLRPGGVPINTVGKHYPGEPIPRWSLAIYRLKSGEALWNDPSTIRFSPGTKESVSLESLQKWIQAIALQIGLPPSGIPAYEDAEAEMKSAAHRGEETPLPFWDSHSHSFKTPPISETAKKRWDDYKHAKGFVLPLRDTEEGWKTETWKLQGNRPLALIPGWSPIGLRLPLSQLIEPQGLAALTVQLHKGTPLVFIPPLLKPESFVQLIRAVESTMKSCGIPSVMIEGYPPPEGDKLDSIGFSPDPGVIEVNLPPADHWNLFEDQIIALYDAAEKNGLRAYKYQFNGNKVCTGGGGHIVFGGPTFEKNPFLETPSLLSSLLRFIHNHPSLSYLFAGLNLGTSSQSPRIDESIGELIPDFELALLQLENLPSPTDPVAVDSILRNLLLDLHGNTHRTELSVDKFWNPFQPNGRLGLVELRAFEMSPDATSFLNLNAFLRSLIASLLEKPYHAKLKNWGNRKRDELALRSFLEKNLQEVLDYINTRGFSWKLDHFKTHLDFRLPVRHSFKAAGLSFEVRQALEFWPVLGEEPSGSSTSRWVDCSSDRLEIIATLPHAKSRIPRILVNGVEAPLRKMDSKKMLLGIRYRMFALSRMLHPEIPSHSPLKIEVQDPKSKKILYAFEYLPWTLNAKGYSGLPLNEKMALKRRQERVVKIKKKNPHPIPPRKPHFPSGMHWTLDLYWNS
ncbi:MAG: transglutaminase family protein [Verrucomicrobiota bacterium]